MLFQDVRLAFRGIRRNPGFAVVVVLTLALGIGATTTIFSIVYALLIKPLPFPRADRLVRIVQVLPPRPGAAAAEPTRAGLTSDQMLALNEHSTTLAHVGRYTTTAVNVTGIPVPIRLSGASVSPGLFSGLGVRPFAGRLFSQQDADTGADPVVILSHATWQRYFGGDPSVVGRRLVLNSAGTRVIGIMPEGFGFPSLASPTMSRNSTGVLSEVPEFWTPLAMLPDERRGVGYTLFPAFALLRSNATLNQAAAETSGLLPAFPTGERPEVEIVSAKDEMTRPVGRALTLFEAGVALILLIACVNVMNLLLSRAAHRRRELTIRRALGARIASLVRTAMTESVILSLLGGAIGVGAAYALVEVLQTFPPHVLPRLSEVRVDAVVAIFAVVLSVATGIGVALFSALAGPRPRSESALRITATGADSAGGHRGPMRSLVVAEVAIAIVLLTGSGLLLNSFVRLISLDPGMAPDGVLSFRLTLPTDRYPTPAAQELLYTQLAERVRALPTVESVAAANFDMQGMPIMFGSLKVDGVPAGGNETELNFRRVTPTFFRSLRISLRAGRDFSSADREGADRFGDCQRNLCPAVPERESAWAHDLVLPMVPFDGRWRGGGFAGNSYRAGARNPLPSAASPIRHDGGFRADVKHTGNASAAGSGDPPRHRPKSRALQRVSPRRNVCPHDRVAAVVWNGRNRVRRDCPWTGRDRVVRRAGVFRRDTHARDRNPNGTRGG